MKELIKLYGFIFIKCAILISLNGLYLSLLSPASSSEKIGKYMFLDDLENDSGEGYKKILSQIPPEDKVLVTWKKHLPLEKLQTLTPLFSDIISVDEYFDSGAVEYAVVEYSKTHKIQRIITHVEYDMVRAGALRQYLGLQGQTYESSLAFRNKVVMKEKLSQAGFKIPPYMATNSGLDLIRFSDKHGFPLVLKPRSAAGALGIHLLKNPLDLKKFLSSHYNCHYFADWEAEAFVEGKVYHIDGIFHKDYIFSWPSLYTNSCLETALEGKILGSYLLEPANPITSKLIDYSKRLLKALPTPDETVFHLEVFVDRDEEIIFCEIASRVGGVYISDALKEGFNIDLASILYDMQSGLFEVGKYEKLGKPTTIAGWLMFPPALGKTIASIENSCPFPYCKKYEAVAKAGDNFDNSFGILNRLAKVLIVSDNEKQFLERAQEVTKWFESSIKYI